MLRTIRDVLFTLLVARDFLLAAAGALDCSILVGYVIWITWLRSVVKRKEEFDVPSKDNSIGAAREKQLFLASLDVAQTALEAGHMQSSQETVLAAQNFIKTNCEITQTNGNRVTLRDELYSIDDMSTLDRRFWFHFDSIIDAYQPHISLKQNDLVNFLKVVNSFNLTIVGSSVYYFR